MISLFHVMFLGIISKFGRHVNSAPLDPCNYIRGSNILRHEAYAHCLNTDYPIGLRLYKGPVVCYKNWKKTEKKLVFCLLLSFSVIFALFELLSWRGISTNFQQPFTNAFLTFANEWIFVWRLAGLHVPCPDTSASTVRRHRFWK